MQEGVNGWLGIPGRPGCLATWPEPLDHSRPTRGWQVGCAGPLLPSPTEAHAPAGKSQQLPVPGPMWAPTRRDGNPSKARAALQRRTLQLTPPGTRPPTGNPAR